MVQLVPAICPNCGGSLNLNPNEKAALCPYCNTPFIVSEAVNSYIEHLHANNVTIVNDGLQKLLNAGRGFLKLKDYGRAYDTFYDATVEYPGDWRSWWGQIEYFIARAKDPCGEINVSRDSVQCYSIWKKIELLTEDNPPTDIAAAHDRFMNYLYAEQDKQNNREREAAKIEKEISAALEKELAEFEKQQALTYDPKLEKMQQSIFKLREQYEVERKKHPLFGARRQEKLLKEIGETLSCTIDEKTSLKKKRQEELEAFKKVQEAQKERAKNQAAEKSSKPYERTPFTE